MTPYRRIILTLLCSLLTPLAEAALDIGDKAPDFTTTAARAGKPFQFSLTSALAKGPVVLYFFPMAFSDGCSIEAHSFAEAITQFEAMGATVVGVSRDDIDILSRFSVQACNGKFAVASDESMAIARSFDAVMQTRTDYANRISYVIAPSGKVVYSYLSLDPSRHVSNTLAALRDLKQRSTK
jgi:peroxiredoxin